MSQVSVIIPTFNSERSIKDALDTLAGQTFKDFEVICIDGGSCDKTKSIIKESNLNLKIKLIDNINDAGPAHARATGISQSSSKYIAFLDGDDSWHPKKLEIQIKFMNKNKVSFSYTKAKILDGKRNFKSYKRNCDESYSYQDYLYKRGIINSSVVIDRNFLTDSIISTQLPRSGEDTLWWQLIMKKFELTAYLCSEEYLTNYTINNNGLSSNRLSTITQQWKNFDILGDINTIQKISYFIRYLMNTFILNILKR